MRRFNCGLVGDEFCVARDKFSHYLIKFTLKNGEWISGNKRGVVIRVSRIDSRCKITMTIGYYEDPPELKMKIKESILNLLIDAAGR